MYTATAAVVGTGFIGPVHVEALLRLGVRVKGVAGSSPDKAEQVRRRFNLATAYPSFEAVLADDDVDVVHLAVPNVLHYPMALRVLRAGRHVLCEKPLAMRASESGHLVQVAAEAGRAAGVCYNIRYYPLNLEAQARIRSGAIGRVHSVVGRYVQDWLLHDTDYNWRVRADQGGALRAVADIGTHWLDLVTTITGLHVEAVCADLATVHAVRQRPVGGAQTFTAGGAAGAAADRAPAREAVAVDTEDQAGVMIRFAGGARGQLWVSQMTAGRKNRLAYEIAGGRQALAWNSEQPNALWIGHRDRPNEVLTRDPALLDASVQSYANYPGGHNEGFPDSFKQCFRAFYEAVEHQEDTKPITYPTFAEGHREVQLCEAILESHRAAAWVTVPPPDTP